MFTRLREQLRRPEILLLILGMIMVLAVIIDLVEKMDDFVSITAPFAVPVHCALDLACAAADRVDSVCYANFAVVMCMNADWRIVQSLVNLFDYFFNFPGKGTPVSIT